MAPSMWPTSLAGRSGYRSHTASASTRCCRAASGSSSSTASAERSERAGKRDDVAVGARDIERLPRVRDGGLALTERRLLRRESREVNTQVVGSGVPTGPVDHSLLHRTRGLDVADHGRHEHAGLHDVQRRDVVGIAAELLRLGEVGFGTIEVTAVACRPTGHRSHERQPIGVGSAHHRQRLLGLVEDRPDGEEDAERARRCCTHDGDDVVGPLTLERPGEGDAHVLGLALDASDPLQLFGALQARARHAPGSPEKYAAWRSRTSTISSGSMRCSAYWRIVSSSPYAGSGPSVYDDDERPRDQARHEIEHVVGLDVAAAAHRLGRFEGARAREDREAAEHHLLRSREHVVGPVDRRAQRRVTLDRAPLPTGKEAEPLVEASRDLRR